MRQGRGEGGEGAEGGGESEVVVRGWEGGEAGGGGGDGDGVELDVLLVEWGQGMREGGEGVTLRVMLEAEAERMSRMRRVRWSIFALSAYGVVSFGVFQDGC